MLVTAQDVIHRAAVTPEYEDVAPMLDSAGFYTFRRYPASTDLGKILTNDGRPAVRCYLAFIVLPLAKGSHISRVEIRAWFSRRWQPGRVFSSSGDPYAPPPGHPDGPSPQSVLILARARWPIDLDNIDTNDFIYDQQEDVFIDKNGDPINPVQMLDMLYTKHCQTLQLGFRIRWSIGSAARWVVRETVWKGQDVAMWALLRFYDVELVEDKKDKKHDFFYKYRPSDFRRVTDKDGGRSHFFGFESSRKSFLSNLVVTTVICLVLYLKAPHDGLLRAVYNNTALSTAALVFVFLFADTLGPWVVIGMICALSRFRDAVLFFIRKVKV